MLAAAHDFGTAEQPDRITIDGEQQAMHCNPLESYFEKTPDKRPRGGLMNTSQWRGYVAHFELRDGAP